MLAGIVKQTEILERQDSLQRIAAMPEDKRKEFVKKIFLATLSLTITAIAAHAQNIRAVTATQVTGVYRFYRSEFRILALGHNKLKVQFDGVYVNIVKSVNTGYAEGEATIKGNVAIFIPEDTQGCQITLTFLPRKLVNVLRMLGSSPGGTTDCSPG